MIITECMKQAAWTAETLSVELSLLYRNDKAIKILKAEIAKYDDLLTSEQIDGCNAIFGNLHLI